MGTRSECSRRQVGVSYHESRRKNTESVAGIPIFATSASCSLTLKQYYVDLLDIRTIAETGSPLSACDSEICRWQIEHGTRTSSLHPIEMLLSAYEAAE